MLVAVFGWPSPMLYWGAHAVRHTVNTVMGSYFFMPVSTIDELRLAWKDRASDHVVFYSEKPDAVLVSLFLKNNIPIINFMDSVEKVIGYTMLSKHVSLAEAAWSVSANFTALSDVLLNPQVLVIQREHMRDSTRLVIANIFDFLLPVEPDVSHDHVLTRLIHGYQVGGDESLTKQIRSFSPGIDDGEEFAFDSLNEGLRRTLAALDQGYGAPLRGKPIKTLRWEQNVFLSLDTQSARIEYHQHAPDISPEH